LIQEATWGGWEAWQVSGKGAAQRDPAQPDMLGGAALNGSLRAGIS